MQLLNSFQLEIVHNSILGSMIMETPTPSGPINNSNRPMCYFGPMEFTVGSKSTV